MSFFDSLKAFKALCKGEASYTVYTIDNNGQEVNPQVLQADFFRKAALGMGALFAIGAVTFGVMQYTIYENNQQLKKLAEFERTKALQEQKLSEVAKTTETVQKDMAALAKVEEQVRQQMQKSGMHVPKQTINPAKYSGKGGNGDMNNVINRMDVAIAQNQNIHELLTAQTKDWQNYLRIIEDDRLRKAALPNHWPLTSGVITSRFGGRRDPIVGGRKNHAGIDIGVGHGTPVYAAGSGYVQHAGWYYGYGNYIKLNHDYGYQTAYGHLSSIAIEAGTYVKKGQLIGRVGSTGKSTGPHLHFEVIKNGKQINPMDLF